MTRARLRGEGVEHPFSGVSTVGFDLDSIVDKCRAYEPRLRSNDVFSHVTAAMLWGIPLPPAFKAAAVHVSAVGGGVRPRTAGVIGHELRGSTAVSFVLGLPVVAPATTFCILAAYLEREDLVAAADFLISERRIRPRTILPALCSLDDLVRAAAAMPGCRGAIALAWALPRARTGVESRPESLLRLVIVAAGYPEPEVAPPIEVDGGRLTLHPDLAWKPWRTLLEYEGKEHWTDPKRMRSDIRRRELFEAAGWTVIRVVLEDLFVDRDAFLRRVETVVAARRSQVGM